MVVVILQRLNVLWLRLLLYNYHFDHPWFDRWLCAVSRDEIVAAILVDLSAAFDLKFEFMEDQTFQNRLET